ncbi:MAG: hypothetical protein RRC34_05540 [Lentisphaeria bacterium]|nr:hypothetical protein [Lentisphaeria bacterium]
MDHVIFQQAAPIWIAGQSGTWNQMAGFHTAWTVENPVTDTILRITGADAYRVWVNGAHAGYGPARTAHGYARVDEWPLNPWLVPGENHLAIEVHSHGIDSYVYVLQPPFLQAEIVCDGAVLAATPDGFDARTLPERVGKVERFSKQRPFAEAYRLTSDCHAWRLGGGDGPQAGCEPASAPALLPRHVPLPDFACIEAEKVVAEGPVTSKDPVPELVPSLARRVVGKRVMGYPVEDLEIDISAELNRLDFPEENGAAEDVARIIPASGHALYDFGRVQGGFIGVRLSCERATRVYLVFDELRENPGDLGVGAIALDLTPGDHAFESMAPYSFRFLRVVTMAEPVQVASAYMREYAYPKADAATYTGNDAALADIFAAARQTFRTNSVDLFTDCPSRERGGYPCDAWFTARAERLLTGENRVERNFLENYFLPETFDGIPDGMVPHCYPSSRLGNGAYIPNWALWLMLQLVDYCERTGDEAMRQLARPRVEALNEWFHRHLNDQGLLEDVPGWIFVDWSPANNYTEGVNHPTNMLYAYCLEALSRLYDRPEWAAAAKKTRAAVLAESWDGRWFADQSRRVNGRLRRTEARSEACQYHAFWTGLVTPDKMPDVWARLRDDWGPCQGKDLVPDGDVFTWNRDNNTNTDDNRPELDAAGLLYGILLRFDLLRRFGERGRLIAETRAVFGPQAALTGTLWEHVHPESSCNHGFAACACDYICGA